MELPKFKLTKKAIVILTAVVIVLLVVITSCSNQASLRKKEREIDREVSDQEQKITETIRLCEEMLSLADEALDELDTLTVAVCERDDFFKNKAQLPATLLLEDPSTMDGYYIQYVNDYVMENNADSYENFVRCMNRFSELYDQVDRSFIGDYDVLQDMHIDACGCQLTMSEANEALLNKEPHTVVDDHDYGFVIDGLPDVYKLDVLLCHEGLFQYRNKLHNDVESCKLLFDFVD